MAVTVLPDAEALVISYLESQSQVTALVSNRVYGDLPTSPSFPLVAVRRIGGLTRWPHYIDQPSLQVEAYGRNRTEASQIARVVHAVLKDMPQQHSRGIVTDVQDSLGLTWQPDSTYSPAKPRYLFGVVATMHP